MKKNTSNFFEGQECFKTKVQSCIGSFTHDCVEFQMHYLVQTLAFQPYYYLGSHACMHACAHAHTLSLSSYSHEMLFYTLQNKF